MHQQPFDRPLLQKRRQKMAAHFDAHSALHAEIADRLDDDLALIRRDFRNILILGGQYARFADMIGARYTPNRLIVADQIHLPSSHIIADEDCLPFSAASFDLVVSNLGLHLVNDIPGSLAQIQRILKPDGLFCASMLGADSFPELRQCLIQAESEITGGAGSRMMPLPDLQSSSGLLQRAGFALPVAHQEIIALTFPTMLHGLNMIRKLGGANIAHGRARKILRRDVLSRAGEIYARNYPAEDGNIIVTLQIIYLTGWAPADNQQKPLARGSGKTHLADAFNGV